MNATFLRLLLFLILFPALLFAQQIVIHGTFPGASGRLVAVYKYADLLTFAETKMISDTVDSDGHFSLTFNSYTPLPVLLKSEFHAALIYVEPNMTYTLNIAAVNFDSLYTVINPALSQPMLDISLQQDSLIPLNDLIYELDTLTDGFIQENYVLHNNHRDKKLLDAFLTMLQSKVSPHSSSFLKEYAMYKMASVKLMSACYSKQELIQTYILSQKPLYHNPAYMSFFSDVFAAYLGTGYSKIKKEDVIFAINEQAYYKAFLDSLGKDTLLNNEVIRELVLLRTLQSLNSSKEYKKQNIFALLAALQQSSKFEQHRIIAANLMQLFSKMVAGAPSPDYSFKDVKAGKVYTPADFKDKNLCIYFWKSNCIECINELDILDSISQKVKDKITFILVNIDYQRTVYDFYCKQHPLKFLNIYWDRDFDLIDRFNALAVPLVVVIDKDGTLVRSNAPLPSENLLPFLKKMLYAQEQR